MSSDRILPPFTAQVHLLVEELLQGQMLAQGRRQEQARIGGQAVVVKRLRRLATRSP